MEKKHPGGGWGCGFLAAFAVFTVIVKKVGVTNEGFNGSKIGLAKINTAFRDLIGVNDALFKAADILGYLAIAVCLFFAGVGLYQLIKTRKLSGVDTRVYLLAALYILCVAAYAAFEKININLRPVADELSYPSSHTVLALCVYFSASMFIRSLKKFRGKKPAVCAVLDVLAVATVACRAFSGYHWLTDIVGGILLSAGFLMLFRSGVIAVISERAKK